MSVAPSPALLLRGNVPKPPPMIDSERGGAKTEVSQWDASWDVNPPKRSWSPFNPSTTDMHRLLKPYVKPGSAFMELGFAPGMLLAWAAQKRGAEVSGIDYSKSGVAAARALFQRLGISGDLRCEDAFRTSFASNSFDCVFSVGLIEHFDDPRPIVAKHVELAKPGGAIVILVPNYGGLSGRVQSWLDPEDIALHNLAIMRPGAMAALFDPAVVEHVRRFKYGRYTLSGLALKKAMPNVLASALHRAAGLAATIIPFRIPPAAMFIAAVAVKRRA